ncbi:MAG: methylated-DNA--[protein]-cysteine S-methyltransferase [Nitrospira sp.]|nr:methylated-DNA--[protein]-cysteine S-methyltransferase [Nitrospira sp.]
MAAKNPRSAASRSTPHASRIFRTSWGWMGVAVSPHGVARIVLPQMSRARAERELIPEGVRGQASSERNIRDILDVARTQILEFLSGRRRELDCPLDLSQGTPFQRKVWRAALAIPYGRVRSYKWIAVRVGGTRYARAVGLALGANPVPILVPCHRVVAQDGSLGGFSCGLPAKRRLLTLEGTLSQLKS